MSYTESILHIGLMGPAGSGKTTTANLLAPSGLVPLNQGFDVMAYHYALATPIHDIVGIKRNTEGEGSESRIMYQLHNILYDLIGASASYDDLVEVVYDIYSAEAGSAGDAKPRSFMQWVGDVVRAYDVNCFADFLLRRIRSEYLSTQKDLIAADQDDDFIMLAYISDVRRRNEVDRIRDQPKSLLIRFEAPLEVLNERLYQRDGNIMTEEQWAHATEREANEIDKSEFNLILDTSELTIKQQAQTVADYIGNVTGVEISTSPVEKVKTQRAGA